MTAYPLGSLTVPFLSFWHKGRNIRISTSMLSSMWLGSVTRTSQKATALHSQFALQRHRKEGITCDRRAQAVIPATALRRSFTGYGGEDCLNSSTLSTGLQLLLYACFRKIIEE